MGVAMVALPCAPCVDRGEGWFGWVRGVSQSRARRGRLACSDVGGGGGGWLWIDGGGCSIRRQLKLLSTPTFDQKGRTGRSIETLQPTAAGPPRSIESTRETRAIAVAMCA